MQGNDLYIVGIGSSAGGHQPLREFMKNIPTDLPAAFVVVTHLLRGHRSRLTEILSRYTTMSVVSIDGMTTVQRGHVYVLPEDVEVKIRQGVLIVNPRRPGAVNRSIDIFFQSLAEDQGDKAIGIVLSGMGSDGSDGAVKLYEHHGEVFVQDPSSAQFNSMPWSVIMKDHPDYILPPAQIATRLGELLRNKTIRVAS
jgi:two-component system CheB/CheR fusion protein